MDVPEAALGNSNVTHSLPHPSSCLSATGDSTPGLGLPQSLLVSPRPSAGTWPWTQRSLVAPQTAKSAESAKTARSRSLTAATPEGISTTLGSCSPARTSSRSPGTCALFLPRGRRTSVADQGQISPSSLISAFCAFITVNKMLKVHQKGCWRSNASSRTLSLIPGTPGGPSGAAGRDSAPHTARRNSAGTSRPGGPGSAPW